MPPPEYFELNDKAVMWAITGTDKFNEPIISSPVELDVRWTDTERVAYNAQGQPITISADVVAYEDIPLRSIMRLGELDEWYGTGSGDQNADLLEVASVNKSRDLKGREERKTYSLTKFKGVLPSPSS